MSRSSYGADDKNVIFWSGQSERFRLHPSTNQMRPFLLARALRDNIISSSLSPTFSPRKINAVYCCMIGNEIERMREKQRGNERGNFLEIILLRFIEPIKRKLEKMRERDWDVECVNVCAALRPRERESKFSRDYDTFSLLSSAHLIFSKLG